MPRRYIGLAIMFFFVRLAVERTLASKSNSLQRELKQYQVIVDEVNNLKKDNGNPGIPQADNQNSYEREVIVPQVFRGFHANSASGSLD